MPPSTQPQAPQEALASATPLRESVWAVEGIFSDGECDELMQRARAEGLRHAAQADGDAGGLRSRLRDCLRVEVHDGDLAARVWARVRHLVPPTLCIRGHRSGEGGCREDPPVPVGVPNTPDLAGTWTAVGVNPLFRLVCYPGEGHFGPHRDGHYAADANHRSFMTINGYLTVVPERFGGATRFLKGDASIQTDDTNRVTASAADVEHAFHAPSRGSALLFYHALVHDGEPLHPSAAGEDAPDKWLFRTDVMFARDPADAPQLTPAQVTARELYDEAAAIEATDALAAAKLYRRAFRIDPDLEDLLREV